MRAVSLPRSLRPLFVSSLVLFSGGGCTRAFIQNEGLYAFTAVEVLRDDCALLTSPESLWDGTLSISGEVIRMDSDLMGMELIGNFLEAGAEDNDAFMLDGSVTNASVEARGSVCLVNQVAVHLTATTQCATEFDGVLRVRYEPQPEQPACGCQLWVRYEAVQNSAPCASPP